MKRWNGWGEEKTIYKVSENAKRFLEGRVGKGTKPNDISLEELVRQVPPSRLKEHSVIHTDSEERVRHSRGQSLADWITIRSGLDIVFPDGVAYPLDKEDIKELIKYAIDHDAILIPYGGGTSVVGHINIPKTERPVISVDMSRMNKLLFIDKQGGIAGFEAGVRGPELEAALRANGFTLGHFPQSFEFSTLGGWIATRSSGQFSANYGRIERLFAGGNIETPIGTLELPPFPASAAGPDIREILLGSEGRFGIITDGTIRVTPLPEVESIKAAFFPTEEDGIKAVKEISQAGLPMAMLRLSLAKETKTTLSQVDTSFALHMLNRYLTFRGIGEGRAMLIYGAVGSKRKVSFALKRALKIIKHNNGIYTGSAIGNHWYKDRFLLPYVRNSLWELGYALDTLETANVWRKVPSMIQAIEEAIQHSLDDINEKVHVFTHLSHVYPHGSSIYTTYMFRISDDPRETLSRWKKAKAAASIAIVQNGGTISHQHGIGTDHLPYLDAEKGPIGINLLKNISNHLDPNLIMNPEKLIP